MALGKQLRVEAVRTLDAGDIGVDYVKVGVSSTRASGILQFQNLTDATLMFSFDGVIDHFPLPANGYFVLDVSTNKAVADGMFLSIGTQFYVKQIEAPTSGSVYITMYYGRG